MASRGALPAACALVALLALIACATPAEASGSKQYDPYAACYKKDKGDGCYHPDVKDKCLDDAKCEYDSKYHKLKCEPGKSKCYDDECKTAKCVYGKCKYYFKKDYTPCDTDKSKCTVEKCWKGECKKFEDLKCYYDYKDYKHYDKECLEEEGYCDPYKGCVGPKFKTDGYECDKDDKCSIKKCYEGKCKKVEDLKCKFDDYHYDKECLKEEGYCNPKYGCVKPKYYQDGYECGDKNDKCTVKKCYEGKCKKVEDLKCKFDDYHYDKECLKKEGYCDPYKGCVGPEYYKDGYECGDKNNKCTIKKCYDGKCKKVEDLKCKFDDYHYDKECLKKEGYCDPYKGCVGPEYYKDGYECENDGNKCTLEKCWKGKCKNVGSLKCKDDGRHKYDKECVKKWAYCDKKYGCKETELYPEGYKCWVSYGKKKTWGACSKWGKCIETKKHYTYKK